MSRRFGHLAWGALLVGCGSSSEPPPARGYAVVPSEDAGTATVDAAVPQIRTLKQVGLFGETNVQNLVLDPSFEDGSPGIGRWIVSSTATEPPALLPMITSNAPNGVSLRVVSVSDIPASGTANPRAFSVMAQLPGGTGPFVAQVWISTEKPVDLATLTPLVRVSISPASSTSPTSGSELPLDPTATRVIDGRTWLLYRGEITGPFQVGAWFSIRMRGSRNKWWLHAPEFVPKALLAEAQTKSLHLARPHALDADELSAIARYRRIPLDYGVGISGVPIKASKSAP